MADIIVFMYLYYYKISPLYLQLIQYQTFLQNDSNTVQDWISLLQLFPRFFCAIAAEFFGLISRVFTGYGNRHNIFRLNKEY